VSESSEVRSSLRRFAESIELFVTRKKDVSIERGEEGVSRGDQ